MGILNYEEMTLESDTFQTAREKFNLMMQKLLKKWSSLIWTREVLNLKSALN